MVENKMHVWRAEGKIPTKNSKLKLTAGNEYAGKRDKWKQNRNKKPSDGKLAAILTAYTASI